MKHITLVGIQILIVICFHGETIASPASSTSPSPPVTNKTVSSEDLKAMKKRILDSLDQLEKLMDRVNRIPVPAQNIGKSGSIPITERQGGAPLGVLGDIYQDLSGSFLNSIRSIQYHVTRLVAASPLCSYPMRAVDPDPETLPSKQKLDR
ncbi:uncharacterized protein LOC141852150 isoform X2 [Brevipalpus obovatus]|uniref:uncharacterized protein LOC141852150 isoform X2 n=1 Tax=Brevipalpus obovatus TaxID=246614 RepID=UPI003D9F90F3